jgi:hypothetical protein
LDTKREIILGTYRNLPPISSMTQKTGNGFDRPREQKGTNAVLFSLRLDRVFAYVFQA